MSKCEEQAAREARRLSIQERLTRNRCDLHTAANISCLVVETERQLGIERQKAADHAAVLAEKEAMIAELGAMVEEVEEETVCLGTRIVEQAATIAAQRALLERAAGALHDVLDNIDYVTGPRAGEIIRESEATLAALRAGKEQGR